MRRGAKTYPDDPDGHDPLHVTLALGHRSWTGLATIAWGRGRNLQDLVGVVDIEEQVGEREDRDCGAHLVGLTTVVSPRKVLPYACRKRAEKAGREGGGGSSGKRERRWKTRRCIQMKMRHTRGASDLVTIGFRSPAFPVSVTPARFALTVHHAENPDFEDQATSRRIRGYRECGSLPHATHVLNS